MKNRFKEIMFLCAIVPTTWGMSNEDINIEYERIIHTLCVQENNLPQNVVNIDQDKYEWASTLLRYSRNYNQYNGFIGIQTNDFQSVMVLYLPECDIHTKVALIELYRDRYNNLAIEINENSRVEQVLITGRSIGCVYEIFSRRMNEYVRKCSEEIRTELRHESNRYKFKANNLFIRTDGRSFMTYG